MKTIATLDNGEIVGVQQGHLLGTTFHPEMTSDTRFHRYFVRLVEERSKVQRAATR